METLVSNLTPKVRRERLHGRDYLVAPLTMIVPGVLNGSKGALYYPPSEINQSADAWNGMPMVVYHPEEPDGTPCSARDPSVAQKQEIGRVYRATANGKLKAEGWFDIEQTRKVNHQVYEDLIAGRPIELSTGLFTDNEERKGEYKGVPYDYIARNYRPDHLAILPGQTGACSIKDGCGVLVNRRQLINNKAIRVDPIQTAQWNRLTYLIDNANPYRDERGRFASADSAHTKDGKLTKQGKATIKARKEKEKADKKSIKEKATRIKTTAKTKEGNLWPFVGLDKSAPPEHHYTEMKDEHFDHEPKASNPPSEAPEPRSESSAPAPRHQPTPTPAEVHAQSVAGFSDHRTDADLDRELAPIHQKVKEMIAAKPGWGDRIKTSLRKFFTANRLTYVINAGTPVSEQEDEQRRWWFAHVKSGDGDNSEKTKAPAKTPKSETKKPKAESAKPAPKVDQSVSKADEEEAKKQGKALHKDPELRDVPVVFPNDKSLESEVAKALYSVQERGNGRNMQSLKQVKDQLPHLSMDQFHSEINRLREAGVLSTEANQGETKILGQAHKAASLKETDKEGRGDTKFIPWVGFRGGRPGED